MKRVIFEKKLLTLILFAGVLIFSSVSFAQEESISASDASKYIGKIKTVCGVVVSSTYAVRSKRQPTFLNLDEPYPNQIFTVVIWGSVRRRFKNPPEELYKGKTICVTGEIKAYWGKPVIIVNQPSQIITNSSSSSSLVGKNRKNGLSTEEWS